MHELLELQWSGEWLRRLASGPAGLQETGPFHMQSIFEILPSSFFVTSLLTSVASAIMRHSHSFSIQHSFSLVCL